MTYREVPRWEILSIERSMAFMPQILVMFKHKELAPGTVKFVSAASAEAETVDAVTGERIAAAVDRRVVDWLVIPPMAE